MDASYANYYTREVMVRVEPPARPQDAAKIKFSRHASDVFAITAPSVAHSDPRIRQSRRRNEENRTQGRQAVRGDGRC